MNVSLINMTNCVLEILIAGYFVTIYKNSEGIKAIDSIINYNIDNCDLYNQMNLDDRETWENEIFSLDIVKEL